MSYRPRSSRTASYLMERTVNLADQGVAIPLLLSGSTGKSSNQCDISKLLDNVTFRFWPDIIYLIKLKLG